MNQKLNLYKLKDVFIESITRNEPTLAFEVVNGKGRFLFMMFFDEEDKSTKDELFIFMKNTQKMLRLKMYGSHVEGNFYLYITPSIVEQFKDELGIKNAISGDVFSLENFFSDLNSSIPNKLALETKVGILRQSWTEIKGNLPNSILDQGEKKYLIGLVKLPPNKKPREKTLRKLYLFAGGDPSDVKKLIERLKQTNHTVSWSSDEKFKGRTIESILKL